jgi:hypothetical protein
VEFGVTTGVDVLNLVAAAGICASLDAAGAPITVEEGSECIADAGTLYSTNPINCLTDGSTVLTAKAKSPALIPAGYQQIFVLTEGFSLTILNVSELPEFEVSNSGFYRIHSLVFNPSTLDLGVVKLGETTGFDVLNLVSENNICASLDVHGAINLAIKSKWFCYFFDKYFNNSSEGLTLDDLPSNFESLLSSYDNYEDFKNDFVSKNSNARLFPNPVVNAVNIELILFDDEDMSYNIVDISGRQVLSGKANSLQSGKETIDTYGLNNGVYLIQLKSNYRSLTKKFIVNK